MGNNKNKYANNLKKGRASFNLVGEVRLGEYTYKMDELSEKGWQYNSLNLGVDCGNGNVVYADMFGGHWANKNTDLYVNSKEDFTNSYTIDWEDRFNEKILETINDINFIKVGIEKDLNEKTFQRKFLSEYDAIAYLKEHLEEDMVVNVWGNLKYSIYNDEIQVSKEIKNIYLSKAKPEHYKAKFVQSILIQDGCVGKFDKELGSYPVNAHVLDYTKMYNGKEVKTTIPFFRQFEIEKNNEKPKVTKALLTKFFKVEGNVTQIVVEGNIIEGQQTKSISEDDIPQDILDLIEIGIYEKDEILNKMAVRGDRVKRYIITKPYVKMEGEDEKNKIPVVFVEKNKYKPEDLLLDFMYDEEEEEDSDDNASEGKKEDLIEDLEEDLEEDDDDSWLDEL